MEWWRGTRGRDRRLARRGGKRAMNGPSAAPLDVYALRQTPPARSAWMDAADLGSRIKRGRFLFSRREEIPKYPTALGNHTGGETARPEMNPVARETHSNWVMSLAKEETYFSGIGM